jgi:hypothetical protein
MPKKSKSRKRDVRIEVRESGVHGHGVYAMEFIPKGTRIIEYTGQRVSWEAAPNGDNDPHTLQRRSNQSGDWRQRRALDQPFLRAKLRSHRRRRPHFHLRDSRYRSGRGTFLRLRAGNRRTDHGRIKKEIRLPLPQPKLSRHNARHFLIETRSPPGLLSPTLVTLP